MRSKRRNTNIKILQSQIQNLALKEEENALEEAKDSIPVVGSKALQSIYNDRLAKGSGLIINEVPVVVKVKKKGVPRDELINTKRLLTM